MRAISACGKGAWPLFAVLGVAWLGADLAAAGAASAAESAARPAETHRVVVSVSAGLARPGDEAVRGFYGGRHTVFGFDCDVPVRGALDVFVGVRFAAARGSTAVVAPLEFEESYAIELASRSLQAGGAFTRAAGARLRWSVGAGLVIGSYEERWPDLGDPVRGSSLGIVGRGSVHYALTTRFGLVARVEVSSLTAREAAADGHKPNLGGVGLSLGASARF